MLQDPSGVDDDRNPACLHLSFSVTVGRFTSRVTLGDRLPYPGVDVINDSKSPGIFSCRIGIHCRNEMAADLNQCPDLPAGRNGSEIANSLSRAVDIDACRAVASPDR